MLAVARPDQPTIDWLALYAQDETGYGNLCALVSEAHLGRPVEQMMGVVPKNLLAQKLDALVGQEA